MKRLGTNKEFLGQKPSHPMESVKVKLGCLWIDTLGKRPGENGSHGSLGHKQFRREPIGLSFPGQIIGVGLLVRGGIFQGKYPPLAKFGPDMLRMKKEMS